MKKTLILLCVIQFGLSIFPSSAAADGISVDAGLTPAENRWVLRTMLHFVQRDNDPTMMNRSMESYMFNTVTAYGLRRDITLMVKQPFARREMSMGGNLRKIRVMPTCL